MRALFTSMTLRGRALLAAGLATALSAVAIGEDDLLRLAVVLIVLPLLCAGYVAAMGIRIRAQHVLSETRVPVGVPVDVDIDVATIGRIPAGTFMCEDTLSPALGVSPRVTFRGASARAQVRLHYTCTPDRRGQHSVGPLAITVADPFGLAERTAYSADSTSVLGLPLVERVPPVLLNSGWATGSQTQTRLLSGRGQDDFSIREHNPGDGLRKVHWRTSARMGKLMIRREEQLQESRAAIFIDDRTSAHRGADQHSTYERAVSLAASAGSALMGTGFRVRVFGANGELGVDADAWSAPVLVDHLALSTPTARKDLGAGTTALRNAREDGLLIALLGDLTTGDAAELAGNRSGAHLSVAVLLDVVTAVQTGAADRSTGRTASAVRVLHQNRREVRELLEARGWWIIELAAGQTLVAAMAGGVVEPGSQNAARTAIDDPVAEPAGRIPSP